jgi:hypothetical protein
MRTLDQGLCLIGLLRRVTTRSRPLSARPCGPGGNYCTNTVMAVLWTSPVEEVAETDTRYVPAGAFCCVGPGGTLLPLLPHPIPTDRTANTTSPNNAWLCLRRLGEPSPSSMNPATIEPPAVKNQPWRGSADTVLVVVNALMVTVAAGAVPDRVADVGFSEQVMAAGAVQAKATAPLKLSTAARLMLAVPVLPDLITMLDACDVMEKSAYELGTTTAALADPLYNPSPEYPAVISLVSPEGNWDG